MEVEGVTGPGKFAPVIREAELRILGKGKLPEALENLRNAQQMMENSMKDRVPENVHQQQVTQLRNVMFAEIFVLKKSGKMDEAMDLQDKMDALN